MDQASAQPQADTTAAMNIDDVLALCADDMAHVDVLIRDSLDSDVVLIRQIAEYIIGSGGKRLRPMLVVLAARACGYKGPHHVTLAAIIEFIHTLLHDDVVDESDMRRGKDSAHAVWGNAASVLVGDFLYSRSFQMMVTVESMRVMEVLSDATNTIAEGEVEQLLNMHDPEVSEARYFSVIEKKTAKLFEAACQLGAVLAGKPGLEESLARPPGLHGGGRHAGQEHWRRPGGGQTHPAPDPGAADARRRGPRTDRRHDSPGGRGTHRRDRSHDPRLWRAGGDANRRVAARRFGQRGHRAAGAFGVEGRHGKPGVLQRVPQLLGPADY